MNKDGVLNFDMWGWGEEIIRITAHSGQLLIVGNKKQIGNK